VAAYCPGRQEKPFRDLLVGHARGGQAGDLELLGGQGTGVRRAGWHPRSPGRPQLQLGPGGPGQRTQFLEGGQGRLEVDPGLAGGPEAAKPFAVDEPDPRDVERPLVGGGQAQCLLEQRGSLIIAGDKGGRPRGQDGQPGRKRGDPCLRDGVHMAFGFGLAVRSDGRFHQVHDGPQAVRGVGCQGARRAHRRGVAVSALEVARAEIGQFQRIVRPDLRQADPARAGPADDLVGERPARIEPALDGGQQRLYVTEIPAEEPSGAVFGDLELHHGQEGFPQFRRARPAS
jgi:hypothetical protein